MTGFGRIVTVLSLASVTVAGGWYGVNALVDNVTFARTQQEVEASRAQLKDVEDLAAVFRTVGKVVEPSVVEIRVSKVARSGSRSPSLQDGLKQFLKEHPGMLPDDSDDQNDDSPGLQVPDDSPSEVGEGSGVIMEVDGSTAYIITNNHVAGGATKLSITLADGRKISNAKVIGTDPKSDLAVIKVEADRLIPAKWGNSDYLEKGDMILAFGCPFGYVGSMTHGIVSALHRTPLIIPAQVYENFIQVDAPINPGNSGGPLVNLKGEVVGINAAIATHSGGFQGIGFAIPSNEAHTVFTALREKGRVVRGFLGVAIDEVASNREEAAALGYTGSDGVIITADETGTPAAGKLMPSDIVTQVNGKPVLGAQPFREQIAELPPGSTVTLDVIRGGKPQKVSIKLAEQPEDLDAVANGNIAPRHGQGHIPGAADALGLHLATPNSDQLERFGLEDGTKGAIVKRIEPGSLAANARLKVGDVITQIGDQPVTNEEDADAAIAKADLAKGVRVYVTDRAGSRFIFVQSQQP